jgi:hypothetical protein
MAPIFNLSSRYGNYFKFFLLSLVRVISQKGVKNQSLPRQPGGAMQKLEK